MEPIQDSNLEARITSLEIRVAVAESNIKEFGKKLDKIDAGISKLLWIMGSVVIVALLNLILKGGI